MSSAIASPAKLDFMVGADPEFAFLDNNRNLVLADTVVKDGNLNEPFGYDGCARVAEVRPAPDKNPLVVVSNIKRALDYGVANNPDAWHHRWRAGSYIRGESLGGHIHFGILDCDCNVVIDALDRYLAHAVILLENPKEARRRRVYTERRYGRLGDYRTQDWGIEYRVLSSWMTSPHIAAGVLCLAKAVVWEVVNNGLDRTDKTKPSADDFNNYKEKCLRPYLLNHIAPEIRRFELYRQYKKQIDFLISLVAQRRNWFPSCGMKAAWGVSRNAKPMPRISRTTLSAIWDGVEGAA